MMDERTCALIDTFLDAAAIFELNPAIDSAGSSDGTRYYRFPHGRGSTGQGWEIFPCGGSAAEAIEAAARIAGRDPHMLTYIDAGARETVSLFTESGYAQNGDWTLMVRSLDGLLSVSGDERAQPVTDPATEQRLFAAMLAGGGPGHPVQSGYAGNPAVRQMWIAVDDEPASYGRLVLLGTRAYMGDVITFPAYRRRGLAGSIVRRLLDEAFAAGATECVLVATPMAVKLYRDHGFTDVVPVIGFETVPA